MSINYNWTLLNQKKDVVYPRNFLELKNFLDNQKSPAIIELSPDNEYILESTLTLNIADTQLNGNGAIFQRKTNTITEHFTSLVVLDQFITIKDLNFTGYNSALLNNDYSDIHHGIVLYNANDVTIQNCTFSLFSGCGVVCLSNGSVAFYAPKNVYFGSKNWSVFGANGNICQNKFTKCYIGIANIAKFEYSSTTSNQFKDCAIGLWDEAGNWIHTGNRAVTCNHGFISTNITLRISFFHKRWPTTPNTGDGSWFQFGNSAHGNINGFMSNHSVDQTAIFSNNATIKNKDNNPIDITTTIGAKGNAVLGQNTSAKVIPPNLNNLTLYYNSLYFKNIESGVDSTLWNVTNVIISGQNATNKGVLSCDVTNKVRVIGLTKQNVNTFLVNMGVL